MSSQKLSFPGWNQLNDEQRAIVSNLLLLASEFENQIEIIQDIISNRPIGNQTNSLTEWQIFDEENDNSGSDVQPINQFIRRRLIAFAQEKPPKVVCDLCNCLGKTDGPCTGC